MSLTLYDKIWNDHLVDQQKDGTALLFVDRHLVHEVTSPQAFEGLRKSNKQKSEDISGLLETAMEDLIEGAVAPKVDHEPDIRLNGKPIEIKTSSGANDSSPTIL